jgi:hypothetical protein
MIFPLVEVNSMKSLLAILIKKCGDRAFRSQPPHLQKTYLT